MKTSGHKIVLLACLSGLAIACGPSGRNGDVGSGGSTPSTTATRCAPDRGEVGDASLPWSLTKRWGLPTAPVSDWKKETADPGSEVSALRAERVAFAEIEGMPEAEHGFLVTPSLLDELGQVEGLPIAVALGFSGPAGTEIQFAVALEGDGSVRTLGLCGSDERVFLEQVAKLSSADPGSTPADVVRSFAQSDGGWRKYLDQYNGGSSPAPTIPSWSDRAPNARSFADPDVPFEVRATTRSGYFSISLPSRWRAGANNFAICSRTTLAWNVCTPLKPAIGEVATDGDRILLSYSVGADGNVELFIGDVGVPQADSFVASLGSFNVSDEVDRRVDVSLVVRPEFEKSSLEDVMKLDGQGELALEKG